MHALYSARAWHGPPLVTKKKASKPRQYQAYSQRRIVISLLLLQLVFERNTWHAFAGP